MADFEAPVLFALVAASALVATSGASAQPAAASDQGTAATPTDEPQAEPLPWHGSLFIWDHAATTQTLGVGADYQSSNPTYEMTLRLAPRYYIVESEANSVSARADVRLVREFTDSEATTDRGEWTFLDTELWLAETHTLNAAPGRHSELVFRAPMLVFPTSKSSLKSGRILALGAGVGLDHRVPLRGENADVLPSLLLRPRANYTYQFADAVVGTNDDIDRFRLDADGRTVRSDQLSGSALPQHQAVLSLRIDTDLLESLGLVTEFGLRYARRYALGDAAEVCGPLGCTRLESSVEATRWSVNTVFAAALGYSPLDYLEVSVGYQNQSQQLGADGRRRSFFYSPDAQAFLAFTVALDVLYQSARGAKAGESSHTATALGKPPL